MGLNNPAGKPQGCRNRASRAAETLLDAEAETLTRRVMEFALDGDPTAMRLCFERIVAPRRTRPVQLDLPPIATPADITVVMAAVTAAVTAGVITPAEGAEVAKVVDTLCSRDRSERIRQTAEGAGSRLCGRNLTPGSRGQRKQKCRAI